MQKKDIKKIDDLSSTKLSHVDGISDKVLKKLKKQAKLQLKKIDKEENIFELLEFENDKGLNRLPKPSNGDIFFDIEGDPTNDEKLE